VADQIPQCERSSVYPHRYRCPPKVKVTPGSDGAVGATGGVDGAADSGVGADGCSVGAP
jgi:hypothetical protein